MRVIGEHDFDLLGSDKKVRALVYEPVLEADGTWICHVVIGAPLCRSLPAGGTTSLQALTSALKILSIMVYSVEGYKGGKLGWDGEFGGDLGIPATHVLLDAAPYPF